MALVRERPGRQRVTVGGDKNYDTQAFVQDLRALQVTPHVAQHTTNRASANEAPRSLLRGASFER